MRLLEQHYREIFPGRSVQDVGRELIPVNIQQVYDWTEQVPRHVQSWVLAPVFEEGFLEFKSRSIPVGIHVRYMEAEVFGTIVNDDYLTVSDIAHLLEEVPRWICMKTVWGENYGGQLVIVGKLFSPVGDYGEALENSLALVEVERDGEFMRYYHWLCDIALTMFHCKNIELVNNSLPDKVLKKRKKRNKPAFVYKTLNVMPLRRIVNKEGGTEGEKIQKALHLCRGHFKDYREKGLFGKYKGLYWWDMHMRGNKREGEIVKDYRVGMGEASQEQVDAGVQAPCIGDPAW